MTPDEPETTTPPTEAAPDIPVEVDDEAKTTRAEAAPNPLETLEKEKKDLHDRLLRTAADFDNFRKRSRKDMDEARAKAREDVVREMLPVVDNLERALAAAGDAQGPIVDGVKLVLRQLLSALERFEVKGFTAVGEPFDPSRHEAIAQVESDLPPGSVATEMQKGYVMGTRLVRPALVAVAKAKAAAAPAAPAEPESKPETKPEGEGA